jgi:hypothetical protein
MQIDNARLPKVIEAVKTAAARISQQLGFAGAD